MTTGHRHPASAGNVLTREMIRDGGVQRMLIESGAAAEVLSEEALAASRRDLLGDDPPAGPVWVFGYGSLIWNPAFHYSEQCIGVVNGYHRQFCLWTHLGRGSPDCPGLVLGLERGGSCRGVAFRMAPEDAAHELEILWRREMVTGAYLPRWVTVRAGDRRVRAIAFTINRAHGRYAGRLDEAQIVEVLATAAGRLGPCADYLFNTVRHLDELGLPDRPLRRLAVRVAERLGRAAT